jgi:hypothetical protein
MMNSADTSHAKAAILKTQYADSSQVEDSWGNPTPQRKLLQVTRCLMVAANKYRQTRRDSFSRIILGKIAQGAILGWAFHTVQVRLIANTLKIATA